MGKSSLNDDSQSYLAIPHSSEQPPSPEETVATQALSPWSRRWLKWRHRCNRLWIYELLSSIIAILLFIGIIVLLATRNGREYGNANELGGESMKQPIIYTYLSLLSAFMRAAMLLPVATAISQLTWSWLRTQRRLIDIERFDEASRGMIGSLELLWTVKFRHLVSVGAAITVLSLPVDAFIQNSVMMPLRRQPNTREYRMGGYSIFDTATIPKSTIYNTSEMYDSTASTYAPLAMIDSVLTGIMYVQTVNTLLPSRFGSSPTACPTGYCNFGKHQTLAISSDCNNRTADIIRTGGDLPYLTLPDADNLGLNETTDQVVVKSYATYHNGSTSAPSGPLIARTVMIISNWDDTSQAIALECATYWTIQTSYARSDDNTLLAVVEFKDYDKVYDLDFDEGQNVGEPDMAFKMWPTAGCWVNNKTIVEQDDPDLYAQECVFRVGRDAHSGLQRYLLDVDDGFNGISRIVNEDPVTKAATYTRLGTYIRNILDIAYSDTEETMIRLNSMHYMIGVFMSRHVRVQGGVLDKNNQLVAGTSQGIVYENVYYYKIAWERLIMPAIMVLGSAIFVIVTALHTKKDLQWRRSTIPLLFHGLSEKDKELGRHKKDLVDMEVVAESLKVQMVEVQHGPRLSSTWPLEGA